MGWKQRDNIRRLLVCGAVMALLLCLILAMGTAWARYRYRETTEIHFTQKSASQIYLWGGASSDGSFTAMPMDLIAVAEGKEISFLISNGASNKEFSAYDQQARVRLFCSLGLGSSDNLTAVLTVGGQTYSAVAIPIGTGSHAYANFGEGWAYCFLDENGNEIRWELAGGQLSTMQMKLQISTAWGVEPSVLQLMVSGEE